jgi:predicted transcriptional regulator YheO
MSSHGAEVSPQSRESSSSSSSQIRPSVVLRSLVPLANALTQFFGESCEVVIHDFSDLDASIIHITGNVTGRKLGGPLTDLGLAILRQGQVPDAVLDYPTYTPDGRRLRSSSVFFKDETGSPFGCICVNVDPACLAGSSKLRPSADEVEHELVETFADSPEAVIASMFERLASERGRPASRMSRQERIELVRRLDRAGAFYLRRAPDCVAKMLGVTRATVYAYLRASNNTTRGKEILDGR